MKDPEMVFGWEEICRQLYPGALSTLKRLGPELIEAGVVYRDSFGQIGNRNNPRRTRVWCYRSTFRTWMMMRGQKMAKK